MAAENAVDTEPLYKVGHYQIGMLRQGYCRIWGPDAPENIFEFPRELAVARRICLWLAGAYQRGRRDEFEASCKSRARA